MRRFPVLAHFCGCHFGLPAIVDQFQRRAIWLDAFQYFTEGLRLVARAEGLAALCRFDIATISENEPELDHCRDLPVVDGS